MISLPFVPGFPVLLPLKGGVPVSCGIFWKTGNVYLVRKLRREVVVETACFSR